MLKILMGCALGAGVAYLYLENKYVRQSALSFQQNRYKVQVIEFLQAQGYSREQSKKEAEYLLRNG